MGSYTSNERLSLLISSAAIIIGLAGSVYATNISYLVLDLGFIELAMVGFITILFLSFVTGAFPSKADVESIFYSGLGKEPYISNDEVYRPKIPVMHIAVLTVGIVVFWLLQIVSLTLEVPLYINVATILILLIAGVYYLIDRPKKGSKK
jgi:hypothetical protein